jgi:hypothetical protein
MNLRYVVQQPEEIGPRSLYGLYLCPHCDGQTVYHCTDGGSKGVFTRGEESAFDVVHPLAASLDLNADLHCVSCGRPARVLGVVTDGLPGPSLSALIEVDPGTDKLGVTSHTAGPPVRAAVQQPELEYCRVKGDMGYEVLLVCPERLVKIDAEKFDKLVTHIEFELRGGRWPDLPYCEQVLLRLGEMFKFTDFDRKEQAASTNLLLSTSFEEYRTEIEAYIAGESDVLPPFRERD